jgi:hypothetical protein
LPDGLYFQTKIPIFGTFWMVLKWKVLVCFIALWTDLRPFGICTYGQLVYFGFVWYIFPSFGKFYKEKSGNTDRTAGGATVALKMRVLGRYAYQKISH